MAKIQTQNGQPANYNATPATREDGQAGAFEVDENGNIKSVNAKTAAGEDIANDVQKVEERFSYAHIAAGAAATNVIKASAGFLHSITFNGPATATNITTVYDNASTSGTVIAIPLATAAAIPTTVTYDVAFTTGLTIITTTANGADMTISYR